jgi:hypothetical protein
MVPTGAIAPGIKAARFIIDQIEQRNHEVIFVDAKQYDFPILHYKEYEKGQFLDEFEWYQEALQRQRKEKGNPF